MSSDWIGVAKSTAGENLVLYVENRTYRYGVLGRHKIEPQDCQDENLYTIISYIASVELEVVSR